MLKKRYAFLSGDKDPCRTNNKMFKKAVQLMRNVGYRRVTSKLFSGMRHEIFNEIRVRDVYAEIDEVLATIYK